jgi:amino acid adenylation domain-containing protein
MLRHFRVLLLGIVSDPDRRLSTLPLLSEAEWQRLRRAGNQVRPDNDFTRFGREEIEQAIPERFAQQAGRYPQRLALKSKSYALNYGQLHRWSHNVAQAIMARRGTEPERLALLFDHDAPMIAGLLGALQAGNTYVPLDTAYPVERLRYILADAQAGVVLTSTRHLALAQELSQDQLDLMNIDELPTGIDEHGKMADVTAQVSPDSPAYILYTSGSTGQPKGVLQSHRNVLYHIKNYSNALHICPEDRLSLIASYSFDAAVMDIFGALLNGASLHLYDIRGSGLVGLTEWLASEEVSIYHSTPTVYRYLLGTLAREQRFPHVRLLVLGGEAVTKRDVELYKKHFPPGCLFLNGLGPTESTLALQYFLDHNTELVGDVVPVGYPVEDTEALLFNEAGEEVSIYATGEIGLRSEHLALSYWRRPELTTEAFLPDPQGGNRRIYRTGDLGRIRFDGCFEFLGRKDAQVKVRGHRVELAEVEVRLLTHPSVSEAAVVDWTGDDGETTLVGYLVVNNGEAPAAGELRRFLKQQLPDYMLPSAFVLLDALPLTVTGKLDRRSLPKYRPGDTGPEQEITPPRTPLEMVLAETWAGVLGLRQIDVHSNFFELGGHSLLAMQIVSQIRDMLGVDLPLRHIFDAPTVAGLAEAVLEHCDKEQVERALKLHLEVAQLSDEEIDAMLAERDLLPSEDVLR